jgi:hypothetical protein
VAEQTRNLVGWIIGLSAGVTAAFITAADLPVRSPFDGALPAMAAALTLLAFVVRRHPLHAALLAGVPLLVVCATFIADDRVRLLSIGLLIAAAVASALLLAMRRGFVPFRQAAAIAVVVLVLLRWIPWRDVHLVPELIVLVGALLLLRSLSLDRGVGLLPLLAAMAAGLITPAEPGVAALFPAVCAGAVFAAESESWFVAIPTLMVALFSGKWLVTIALAPVVGVAVAQWLTTRRPADLGSQVIAPPLSLRLFGSLAALRTLLFAPGALRASSAARAIAALALIVAAAVARPALAPLLTIAALLIAMPRDRSSPLVGITATFGILILALAAWSGIPARMFPLPLPLSALVCVAAVAVLGAFSSLASGVATIAIIALVGSLLPAVSARREPLGRALSAGEVFELRLPPHVRSLSLIASGATLSHMKPGTAVGRLDLIDDRGAVLRRPLTIGDIADWGFLRRDHFFASRNALPAESAGEIHGFGYSAFIGGQGRIPLQSGRDVVVLRITADPALPRTARLQLDGVELPW